MANNNRPLLGASRQCGRAVAANEVRIGESLAALACPDQGIRAHVVVGDCMGLALVASRCRTGLVCALAGLAGDDTQFLFERREALEDFVEA